MKKIAEIWYVAFSELVNQCHLAEVTIRSGILRGSVQWQSIADPDDRRKRLIRYDTMAPKYQALVRKVLCGGFEPWEMPSKTTYDVFSERSLSELLEIACKDGFRRYLGLYPLMDTGRAALKTQTCLARAAAIVELLGNYIQANGLEKTRKPYLETEAWAK